MTERDRESIRLLRMARDSFEESSQLDIEVANSNQLDDEWPVTPTDLAEAKRWLPWIDQRIAELEAQAP